MTRGQASRLAFLGLAFLPLALLFAQEPPPPAALHPDETHLANLRQLTFGGENAESYWSPDGKQLIFQSSREGTPCDQELVLDGTTKVARRVSNREGRTTCGCFHEDGRRVLYASTHLASRECPPDFSKGYVWGLSSLPTASASSIGATLLPTMRRSPATRNSSPRACTRRGPSRSG